MRVVRLLLRYYDGRSEWCTPADVPEIGADPPRDHKRWPLTCGKHGAIRSWP